MKELAGQFRVKTFRKKSHFLTAAGVCVMCVREREGQSRGQRGRHARSLVRVTRCVTHRDTGNDMEG